MKNQNLQFNRTTPPVRIVGSLLCALLVSFAALTARAQTAAVIAPQGDAFYTNGHEAPAFLDIIAASFTNGWDSRRHPMRLRTGGIWELFLPNLAEGSTYKYHVRSRFHGFQEQKADPYATRSEW